VLRASNTRNTIAIRFSHAHRKVPPKLLSAMAFVRAVDCNNTAENQLYGKVGCATFAAGIAILLLVQLGGSGLTAKSVHNFVGALLAVVTLFGFALHLKGQIEGLLRAHAVAEDLEAGRP